MFAKSFLVRIVYVLFSCYRLRIACDKRKFRPCWLSFSYPDIYLLIDRSFSYSFSSSDQIVRSVKLCSPFFLTFHYYCLVE
uniref:Putative secreted peptide n=1 Tax=Anopheles braziliensis TaxID=58242 RepID=A0A2M3ZWF3_9DIPT